MRDGLRSLLSCHLIAGAAADPVDGRRRRGSGVEGAAPVGRQACPSLSITEACCRLRHSQSQRLRGPRVPHRPFPRQRVGGLPGAALPLRYATGTCVRHPLRSSGCKCVSSQARPLQRLVRRSLQHATGSLSADSDRREEGCDVTRQALGLLGGSKVPATRHGGPPTNVIEPLRPFPRRAAL